MADMPNTPGAGGLAYELPDRFDDEHVSPLLCGGLIGISRARAATVPEKGRLLLVGFGSSAHIVIQIALHRRT